MFAYLLLRQKFQIRFLIWEEKPSNVYWQESLYPELILLQVLGRNHDPIGLLSLSKHRRQ